MSLSRAAALAAIPAAAVLADALPSVTAIGPLRTRVQEEILCGPEPPTVAFTFDDGPDPDSTPRFVSLLDDLAVSATFFVLGSRLAERPDLGRLLADHGHQVGVHGWTHRPHLLRGQRDVAADLGRAHALVRSVTGAAPRFWRPPHGILTMGALWSARRLGMSPVLWTADGRDWRADATGASVTRRIERALRPGGVVLLHDADTASAPDSWLAALEALPPLVARCRERGLQVGPLRSR